MRTGFLAALAALAVGAALWFGTRSAPAPAAPVVSTAPPGPGMVYRFGTYALALTDRTCPDDEMSSILESEGIPPARATVVTSGARRYSGCWALNIDGDVLSLDVLSAESGTLPKEGFRREPAP